MTTYAPNYTPRYRVIYVAAGVQHTMTIRGPRGTNFGGMTSLGSVIHNVFNPCAALLADDFHYVSADIALTDSDVFAPTTVPSSTTGLVAVSDYSPMHKATGTTFSGRAPGSKARLTAYGLFWNLLTVGDDSANGIVTAAEEAAIGNVVTNINGNFCAGSGALALWYSQATVKVNDLLLKKIRRGLIS